MSNSVRQNSDGQTTKRQIRPSHRSITGTVPSSKAVGPLHFESSLERDLLICLDNWWTTVEIETQPVTIEYKAEGKSRRYTPDVRARFWTGAASPCHHHHCLFEVKYRQDLRDNWSEFRPKFRAAQEWARQQGMLFQVITERSIRTPFLENARLLAQVRDLGTAKNLAIMEQIERQVEFGPGMSIGTLIAKLPYPAPECRRHILHWVATRWLLTDLFAPISDSSVVRHVLAEAMSDDD